MNARLAAVTCFALVAVTFVADALTPQLFVVAILLNGPIALSGIVLRPRLTVALVVIAEIANVVAASINGAQNGYRFEAAAVGDRVLTAASFVLVGYLTVRATELARHSGVARERERRAATEARLRRALDGVQRHLNAQLVLRAAVTEARTLFEARETRLILRASALLPPEEYSLGPSGDVRLERRSLEPHVASLGERAMSHERVVSFDSTDPIARDLIEKAGAHALVVGRIDDETSRITLLAFVQQLGRHTNALFESFCDGVAAALARARLFERLGAQNEEIARQNEALDERGRVIRDIVYALAHDLRTPLSAASVTMQQALGGAYGPLPPEYREILATSIASNEDVRNLVETLLFVARYESGEVSSTKERVDLGAQIERVTRELASLADSKGVTLDARANGKQTIVTGDAFELRRAVSNLVANALAATPKGGAVTVALEGGEGVARVFVDDNGYGVAPHMRNRLFERLSRREGAMGGGTGLGLYIVRRIAEHHGGSVAYEPKPDGGSRFTLTLASA